MERTIFCLLIIMTILSFINICLGTENQEHEFQTGIVTTNSLNLRTGTDTSFPTISKINKNESVRIYGKIGDWYIVQCNDSQIGVASAKYISLTEEPIYTNNGLSVDENEVLSIVNKKRAENGLSPLIIDDNLQNVARLKANDLVENNYFAHTSPVYGSPFEMLKSNPISYKTASENIAGNSSLEEAINSWISSESHRKNILSNDYNYTGIGVVNSITYGKIIVEFFIGK